MPPGSVLGLIVVVAVVGAVTAAVALDVEVLWPALFEPVKLTRRVWDTSAVARRYEEPVAPAMAAQPLPDESQRSHWLVNEIG